MTDQIETRERELLSAYVTARNKREMLEAQSASAYKEMEAAKSAIVTYLEDQNKKSTGNYSDLGSLVITEPIASFKIPEENKDAIYPWVKEIGAQAVIKEQIHHATLQSLLRERNESGQGIPDFVTVVYVAQVKYIKPKG